MQKHKVIQISKENKEIASSKFTSEPVKKKSQSCTPY